MDRPPFHTHCMQNFVLDVIDTYSHKYIHEINLPPKTKNTHERTSHLSRFVSLTHTHVGGGRARREEVHSRRTYSRLFPNHTRAGTRWSSFLYKKGRQRGNLARVLVVHLMEGGSSTTGEQANCDLTGYVKKEANHVGPTLEARLVGNMP